jgi:hypothetical protein
MPGVKVAAVHNRTREKAEALAAEVGATVYDSYDALLEQDLDAVWVATPDHLHVDASKKVLESGKHLFLEKALATSVADGAEIVAAGAAHPELKSMVAYPLRFSPAFRAMKETVSRGDAGKPIQAWSMRTHFLDRTNACTTNTAIIITIRRAGILTTLRRKGRSSPTARTITTCSLGCAAKSSRYSHTAAPICFLRAA